MCCVYSYMHGSSFMRLVPNAQRGTSGNKYISLYAFSINIVGVYAYKRKINVYCCMKLIRKSR